MNKIVFLLITGSFIFFSCKKPPAAVSPQIVDIKKAAVDFHPAGIDFVYLSTKTKLEYTDGSSGDQFALSVRVRKDSVIWLSIGKAGVEGVRGLLRPDSVFVLDKLKNDSYSYDVKYLQNLIQSDLSYSNIQNLLVGDLVFPYEELTDAVLQNETHFILNQEKENLLIESYIRLDNMKVEKATVIDSVANSKTVIAYSNFLYADSILVPAICSMDISFTSNNKPIERKIVLTHSKIEFPTKPLNFPFNVPKKFNEK